MWTFNCALKYFNSDKAEKKEENGEKERNWE